MSAARRVARAGAAIVCALAANAPSTAAAEDIPSASQFARVDQATIIDGGDTVSASGAFTHRVALDLPAGRQGVGPDLAIEYNSSAPNGLLGVGFRLTGIPAIGRMNWGRGVNYDGLDTYVFLPDGVEGRAHPDHRVVRRTGAFHHLARPRAGQPMPEIQAVGTCGDGPCYWVLRDGHGMTYWFGYSSTNVPAAAPVIWEPENGVTGNRGIALWSLYRVQDFRGNYYVIDYHKNSWTVWPRRIEYTRHTTTPMPHRFRVDFEYGSRDDVTPMPSRTSQRLRHIQIYGRCGSGGVGCTLIRRYALDYDRSLESGRSLLASISEFGGDNTPGPVRRFGWSVSGRDATGAHPIGALEEHPLESPLDGDVVVCDVNGDGRDDIVSAPTLDTLPSHLQVLLAVRNGAAEGPAFQPVVTHPVPSREGRWSPLCGDLDGDGYDDVILLQLRDDGISIDYARGRHASDVPLHPMVAWPHAITWPQMSQDESRAFHVAPGDVNGDLRLDLVIYNSWANKFSVIAGGSDGHFAPLLHHPSRQASAVTCSEDDTDPLCVNFHGLAVGDFDGDGIHDAVAMYSTYASAAGTDNHTGILRWAHAYGDETEPLAGMLERVQYISSRAAGNDGQVVVGDVNGDGRADLIFARSGVEGTIPPGHYGEGQMIPYGREIRVLYGPNLGGTFFDLVVENDGTFYPYDLMPLIDWGAETFSVELHPPMQHFLADVDGDGIDDSLAAYRGGHGTRVDLALATPTGTLGNTVVADDPHEILVNDPQSQADIGVVMVDRTSGLVFPIGPDFWRNGTVDLNGDGNQDLVVIRNGFEVGVVYALGNSTAGMGTPGGAEVLRDVVACPTCRGPFEVRLGDFNGDGKHDVLLPGAPLRYLLSVPGTPDLLVRAENGYGGVKTIEYETSAGSSPAVVHAIRTEASCGTADGGTGSGASCGLANRTPRNLVTRVTDSDGRGFVTSTAFSYVNGRVLGGRLQERTDLGFQVVRRTNEQTGQVQEVRYRQFGEVTTLPAEERTSIRSCFGSACAEQLMKRVSYAYRMIDPYPGIQAVAIAGRREEKYERDTLVSWVETVYLHDPTYLVVTEETSCSSTPRDPCLRTIFGYSHRVIGSTLGRWIIGRPDGRIVSTNDAPPRIVDMERTIYDATRTLDVVRRDRIFFPDAELATCDTIGDAATWAEACVAEVSSGDARWIAVKQNIRYDVYGNESSFQDALLRFNDRTYDPSYATFLERDVNHHGLFSERVYDAAGRVVAITDPNGQVTAMTYDGLGRKRQHIPPGIATPAQREWGYQDFGDALLQRVRETTYPNATRHFDVERWFDGDGHVYHVVEFSDVGVIHTRDERFHSVAGELVLRRSEPYFSPESPRWIETLHDPAGRPYLVQRLDPFLNVDKVIARTVYHADGSVSRIDAEGRETRRYYDARGRLRRLDDAAGRSTFYEYDLAGRLRRVLLPPGQTGNEVTYVWDSWGRKVAETDSATGTTQYAYDDVGNRTSRTDATGQVITWEYDALNRVIYERGPSILAIYAYDQPGHGESAGRLSWVTDRTGTVNYVYDERGNVVKKEHDVGLGTVYAAGYVYDQADRIVEKRFPVGLPDEAVQTFTFANDGTPLAVTHGGVTFARYDSYTADRKAGVVAKWIGPGGVASNTSMYSYDADGLVEKLQTIDAAGVAVQDLVHTYDDAGILTGITDRRDTTLFDTSDTSATQSFGYDALYRLTSATGVYGSRTYEYDALGNITRNGATRLAYAPCSGGSCITGTVGSTVHWIATHDAAGKRVAFDRVAGLAAAWDYVYDENQRLEEVWKDGALVLEVEHDHASRRVKKAYHASTGSYVTYYIGDDYELRFESSAPGTVSTTHRVAGIATVNGGSRIAAQPSEANVINAAEKRLTSYTNYGPGMGTWLHHADHLGSNAVTTQASTGRTVSDLRYEPYGTLLRPNSTGRDAHTRKFTGHELDEETWLYYMGARYYDPLTARFVTADPVTPREAGGAQRYNRFSYSGNSPVHYVDPSGYSPVKPTLWWLKQGANGTDALFGPDLSSWGGLSSAGWTALTLDATLEALKIGTTRRFVPFEWIYDAFWGSDVHLVYDTAKQARHEITRYGGVVFRWPRNGWAPVYRALPHTIDEAAWGLRMTTWLGSSVYLGGWAMTVAEISAETSVGLIELRGVLNNDFAGIEAGARRQARLDEHSKELPFVPPDANILALDGSLVVTGKPPDPVATERPTTSGAGSSSGGGYTADADDRLPQTW